MPGAVPAQSLADSADAKPPAEATGGVLSEENGRTILPTLGSDWNGSSGLWVLPDAGSAIAVSTNKGFEQPAALVEGLADLWGRLP